MKLQLLSLSAREMALRRTIETKPRYLFMLITIKVLLILTALSALASAPIPRDKV